MTPMKYTCQNLQAVLGTPLTSLLSSSRLSSKVRASLGMIPKVRSAVAALLLEIFTDGGIGTEVIR